MTDEELIAETSEGPQELQDLDDTSPEELAIEQGSAMRLPEGLVLDPGDIDVEFGSDETMIINMGPQHPSTHGVLRIMLELEGETVMRSKPIIGYLHTGMEKTGEQLTYVQGATNVTRMDYLSPLHNELVYSLAVEALLGIEIPRRATWIRMLMTELNRIASHVMWMATNGMDLASTSMMIYGFRDREMILSFFEKTTGLRMNHDYIRPGGVAADLPDGWEDDVTAIIDTIPGRVDEYDGMLTGQPIFKQRTEGVGIISPELAIAMSATGPILRASGVAWDLRRDMPYLAYDEVDFDVIVGTVGDTYDRYAVRLNEIRESCKIVRQCIDKMPLGDYRAQDKKVTPPPRARIDESMEALIHHFKIFTRGFEVPDGEVYVAIESPRGELGCYMVSDGSNKPYRMHIRGPSFVNLQTLPPLLRGGLIADAIAVISSVDPVMGEVDR
ncbi:MAG: NADH-quinone oxidoreductase subunit D [Acidimicrobiales bacterium]